MVALKTILIYYTNYFGSSLVLGLEYKELHNGVDRALGTETLSLTPPLSISVTLDCGFFIYITEIIMSIFLLPNVRIKCTKQRKNYVKQLET